MRLVTGVLKRRSFQSDDDPFDKHRVASEPSYTNVVRDDGHYRHAPSSSSTRKRSSVSKDDDEDDFRKPQSTLKRRDSRRSSEEVYPRKKTRDDFEDRRRSTAGTEEQKGRRPEASSVSQSHEGHAKRSASREQQDAESEHG